NNPATPLQTIATRNDQALSCGTAALLAESVPRPDGPSALRNLKRVHGSDHHRQGGNLRGWRCLSLGSSQWPARFPRQGSTGYSAGSFTAVLAMSACWRASASWSSRLRRSRATNSEVLRCTVSAC